MVVSTILGFLALSLTASTAAAGDHRLVGYWCPQHDPTGVTTRLRDVSPYYNIVNVAFATFDASFSHVAMDPVLAGQMSSNPYDVSYLQGKGKTVMLSVGGSPSAGGKFPPSSADVSALASDIVGIVSKWKLDGVDIDDEVLTHDDNSIQVLIALVKALKGNPGMSGKRISLTAQCVYILPDSSSAAWRNTYVPVLAAVGDMIDSVHFMAYNNPSFVGTAAQASNFYKIWTQGNGFNYPGFPDSKVFLGLLACEKCGGSGFLPVDTATGLVRELVGAYDGFAGVSLWDWSGDAAFNNGTFSKAICNAMNCTGSGPSPPSPSPSDKNCTGCTGGTSGPCKDQTTGTCSVEVGGVCPGGTTKCGSGPSPPPPSPNKTDCCNGAPALTCRDPITNLCFPELKAGQTLVCPGGGFSPCSGSPPSPPGQQNCTGCSAGSSGQCQNPTTKQCFPELGGACPGGTAKCSGNCCSQSSKGGGPKLCRDSSTNMCFPELSPDVCPGGGGGAGFMPCPDDNTASASLSQIEIR